jgi:hypothetical protein
MEGERERERVGWLREGEMEMEAITSTRPCGRSDRKREREREGEREREREGEKERRRERDAQRRWWQRQCAARAAMRLVPARLRRGC